MTGVGYGETDIFIEHHTVSGARRDVCVPRYNLRRHSKYKVMNQAEGSVYGNEDLGWVGKEV